MTDPAQSERESDRFLSCVDCGMAYPIDTMFEDEACYHCDGELAVRLMPLIQDRDVQKAEEGS